MSRQIAILGLVGVFFFSASVVFALTSVAYATDPNLVGWLEFEEGSGTDANDSSGYGNDGTLHGNPQWVTGKIGSYALDFDGVGDYIQIPDDDSLTPNDKITIAFWLYNRGGQNAGIYKYAGCPSEPASPGASRAYYMDVIDGTGKLRLRIYSLGDSSDAIESNNVVTQNQWHHIAGTFDQGEAVVYIDGQLDNSATLSVSSIWNDAQPLIVGGYWEYCTTDSFVSRLNGEADDVRIYNRALTAGEIEQLYQEGLGYKAFNPNPTDGAVGVDLNAVLSWSSGKDANSHDVYLGTDYNDVNEADIGDPNLYMGNQEPNSWDPNNYDPNGLAYSTTYYWRIDEVNDTNDDSPWKGNVWSFKTDTPLIELSVSEFKFTGVEGATNPGDQILSIRNSGVGTLNWTISYDCNDCNWLQVDPNSGSSTGEPNEVTLSVDITGLAKGIYDCDLTVSDLNAGNSPQTVTATLYVADSSIPVSLHYDAEAYAYTHAVRYGEHDSDEDLDNKTNSKALAETSAGAHYMEWCGPQNKFFYYDQYSDAKVSVDGSHNSDGAWLLSTLNGWGFWCWYDECGGGMDSGTGDGDGNGYTSLIGAIGIGIFEGYPAGSPGLTLQVDAVITGDAPGAWQNWDWWLSIWDDDPNNPLAVLDDSNMSANLEVLTGQILNIEFYHEAGSAQWPEAGLESSVRIDLELFISADIDGDGDVDLVDYALLANQWLQTPGVPSADIAPPDGDGIVDINDLAVLVDDWLNCCVMLAGNPRPADDATAVAPYVVLSWSPGQYAVSHDVYFGTDYNDVNEADIDDPNVYMGNQEPNSWDTNNYDPNGLEYNTTYYWRIDEVSTKCMEKGKVWSFTTGGEPSSHLVGWWRFDEGSGTDANDSSGNGNDGTLYGDPNWVAGKVGASALDFDGAGDYVQIPDDDSLTPGNKITIAFWLYNRGGQNAGIYKIAACPSEPASPGASRAYFMEVIDSTGKLKLRIYSLGDSSDAIESNNVVTQNQWHHIAGTFDQGEAVVYIDGQLDNSATLLVSSIWNDAQPLIIGGYWEYCGTDSFVSKLNGKADEVRVYDRALTAGEIEQLYQQGSE